MFTGTFETETLVLEIAIPMALAIIFGGVIGLERELKDRPAGLRTNMLVSLAAATFTLLSAELISESLEASEIIRIDTLRIIEAVIAGVAFFRRRCDHSRGPKRQRLDDRGEPMDVRLYRGVLRRRLLCHRRFGGNSRSNGALPVAHCRKVAWFQVRLESGTKAQQAEDSYARYGSEPSGEQSSPPRE